MSEFKKLTMEDFEKYFINKEDEGNVCIHCSTQEESDKLCEIMDLYKIKPRDFTKYADTKWYNAYNKDPVYYNDGEYADIDYAIFDGCNIFEFADITNKEANTTNTTEQEERVLKMLAEAWHEFLKLDTQYLNEKDYFADGINQCQSMIAMRIARNSRPDLFPIKK